MGVGVTLGVVGLVLGGYLLWRRRKQQGELGSAISPPPNSHSIGDSDKEVLPFGSNQPRPIHGMSPATFEVDGRHITPDGELEDQHGVSVAREREGRTELR